MVNRMPAPTVSYLICSTPRTGSSLLCDALTATGVAGRPEEYFQFRARTGYPRRLALADIPVPSRILTVCDIYDALTASDRPYKKAVPRERAIGILEDEAREGKLDPWLVKTFVDEKVWIPLVGA